MEMICGIQWHGVALINYCDEEPPEAGALGDPVAAGNNDDYKDWGRWLLLTALVCTQKGKDTLSPLISQLKSQSENYRDSMGGGPKNTVFFPV